MDNEMKLKSLIAQYCEVAAVDMTNDMRFREDLGFTSLGFMSFLGEIEDEYDVELDQDLAVEVHTIGEALDMLHKLSEE